MLTNVKGKTGLIAERAEPAASLSRDWSRPWLADGGHRTFRDPDFLCIAGLDLGRGQIRLDCAKCDKPDAVVTEGGGPELVRRREPPPMTEVVPTKLRRAREMLLRIQSFYLNAFQSQIVLCLHVGYGGLFGTWGSHSAPQARILVVFS